MKIGTIRINEWFKFEGDIDGYNKNILRQSGWFVALMIWWVGSLAVNSPNLPSPVSVFAAYGELLLGAHYTWNGFGGFLSSLFDGEHLLAHIGFSVGVNIAGYLEAAIIAIPLGFLIALVPAFRYSLEQPLNAIRYIPMPAIAGIFIVAFGSGIDMKFHFLAMGIMVYLLPIVVQRVLETQETHKQTMRTLNATATQKLRYLYIPSVMMRVSVDIIVLVAISWTYITIIEVINRQGGLGAVASIAARNRSDIVYAIIVLIMFLGTFQDALLRKADRKVFPSKYA